MAESLRFDGEICMATVTKRHGRWFVCLTVETGEETPAKREGETIGIDMGLKTLATYSDGTTIENPTMSIDRQYRKLRRVDKAIARSRNVHGKTNRSNRRQRLKDKRQRIYGRIENIRNDVHHKATSALAKATTVGQVIVETLNVAGMRKNKRLSRAFQASCECWSTSANGMAWPARKPTAGLPAQRPARRVEKRKSRWIYPNASMSAWRVVSSLTAI